MQYDVKHSGTAILCGSATCLMEDLEGALSLRPNAVVLGVNYVPGVVPQVEHAWTQHNEFAISFKERVGRKIFLHSRSKNFGAGAAGATTKGIDYVWPDLDWVRGSSGGAGGLWAKHGLGFDEVIYAGVPLSEDTPGILEAYLDQEPSMRAVYKRRRPEAAVPSYTAHNIRGWQGVLLSFKEQGKMQGIYSMSGFTRGILGAPPLKLD